MSEPAPPGMARPPLPAAAALLAAALLHCAPAAPARRHKPDVSRKQHTWKEQAPWLAALVSAVGTGVPAKGFPVAAAGHWASWNPPRCGVPDLPALPDGQSGRNRQKRFVLSGGRWDKTNLTYKIIRFPWQLVKAKVRRTIEEALKVWSDVTPLTFTEVQEGRADIVIDFTRSSILSLD